MPPVPPSPLVQQARAAFPVLLCMVLFLSFVFEPYQIPSLSMLPTLIAGDFIIVSKFSYGLRLPFINTKILSIGEPRRGDVIVFRSPTEHRDLIKRLVGLPGEHVRVHDNRVFINGQLVPLELDGFYSGTGRFGGAQLARERLDDREHTLLLAAGLSAKDFEDTVPAHCYFFMGDNRNDSADSRYPEVGFVPEENLVGPALAIWMSWRLPDAPVLSRIGQHIH